MDDRGVVVPDDCQTLRHAVKKGEVRMAARVRGQYPGTQLKAGCLPGLRTVGYWDAVGPQHWGLPMHRNEGIEICYLLSGELPFSSDHETVMLQPGDVTITRPWQRHCLGDPSIRPCRLFWLILDVESSPGRKAWHFPDWIGPDDESRNQLLRIYRKNLRCHIADPEASIRPFLLRTCELLDANDLFDTAQVSISVNYLLFAVARLLSVGIKEEHLDPYGFDQTIRSFFQGLQVSRETAAEPWTVASMAKSCRAGTTYLNASCKKLFNSTPGDYLCRIRLAHAAELLAESGETPITEIAFAVGFNSSQYFATCFRQLYGCTPGKYRKNQS